MKTKRNTCRVLVALVILLPAVTWAGPYARGRHAESFWVDAQVLHVEPRLRLVEITTPREVCWDEPVRHVTNQYESHTPKVVGGILGGVLGNQFGGGRGRTAMTVAGALLGASVGRDVAHQRAVPSSSYTSVERRCELEQVVHTEERIDGYRVTYLYQGREMVTETKVDPGNTIRVRVRVDSVTYNDHPRRFAPNYRPRKLHYRH